MQYPQCYQGNQGYAFISYAHADSHKVFPILSALQQRGIRLWYDSGIEIGTEWPEYIAQALHGSSCVLCFLSQNSVDSDNCRREINFAIAQKKDILVIYLEEDIQRPLGVAMQLDSLQAVFLHRYRDINQFFDVLSNAKLLKDCKAWETPAAAPQPVVPLNTSALERPALFAEGSRDCIAETLLKQWYFPVFTLFILFGAVISGEFFIALFAVIPLLLLLLMLYLDKLAVGKADALRKKVMREYSVLAEGPATCFFPLSPAPRFGAKYTECKGWLFLTGDALLFFPLSPDGQVHSLAFALADIKKLEAHSSSESIVLKTGDAIHNIQVAFPKRWLKAILDTTK